VPARLQSIHDRCVRGWLPARPVHPRTTRAPVTATRGLHDVGNRMQKCKRQWSRSAAICCSISRRSDRRLSERKNTPSEMSSRRSLCSHLAQLLTAFVDSSFNGHVVSYSMAMPAGAFPEPAMRLCDSMAASGLARGDP
jgi:hypothetical protein